MNFSNRSVAHTNLKIYINVCTYVIKSNHIVHVCNVNVPALPHKSELFALILLSRYTDGTHILYIGATELSPQALALSTTKSEGSNFTSSFTNTHIQTHQQRPGMPQILNPAVLVRLTRLSRDFSCSKTKR